MKEPVFPTELQAAPPKHEAHDCTGRKREAPNAAKPLFHRATAARHSLSQPLENREWPALLCHEMADSKSGQRSQGQHKPIHVNRLSYAAFPPDAIDVMITLGGTSGFATL